MNASVRLYLLSVISTLFLFAACTGPGQNSLSEMSSKVFASTASTSGGSGNVINAASCNQSDVNEVINGPTHVAVDGDIIQIPAGTCTWTSQLRVPGEIGITIRGTGTPNNLPSQMGAASSQTTIIDNRPDPHTSTEIDLIDMSPIMGNSTSRISMLTFTPYDISGSTKYSLLFSIWGRCNVSGCPNMRIDNITISGYTGSSSYRNGFGMLDNVFGVADHNTVGDANHAGSIFLNLSSGSYLGVGQFGDNSWAQPDSFGTDHNFYLENNVLYNFAGTDTSMFSGGARFVCRFNQFTETVSTNIGPSYACSGHGTEAGGRMLRGMRHYEAYGNSYNCSVSGYNCFVPWGFRSATGRIFGNTYSGSSSISYAASIEDERAFRSTSEKGAANFGMCDGTGPFDTNDGVVYYQGTIGSVAPVEGQVFPSADFTFVDSGNPGWAQNQWAASAAGAFSFHDVTGDTNDQNETGPWGTELGSNTANSITSNWNGNGKDTPHVGDVYQILRTTVCLDQPARGAGLLIQNNAAGNPVLASTGQPGPDNQVLDPIYFVDENYAFNNGYVLPYSGDGVGTTGKFQKNRDFYNPNPGQGPQTSPSSPFNGSPAGGNPGVGWGPLSLRPGTCATGVAYFATDQGSWNQSGNSLGQGALYICTNNEWPSSPSYVPYQYPHPLVSGSDPSPTPAPNLARNPTSHPTPTSYSVFTSQVPNTVDNSDGTNVNYELGLKFRSSKSGHVMAIRFYKGSRESDTHTGKIWSSNGTLLASVTFANETASGWQTQTLSAPLSIHANTTYVVSVNTRNTYYVDTVNGLQNSVVNGPLRVAGGSGVFGIVGNLPTQTWNASNYFRDIVFQ